MKKIIILVSGLMFIGFVANAQLKLGGKVGVNISRWVYENDSEDDVLFNPGYHAGGIIIYGFPFGLEIESGLLICQKGVSYDNFILEGIKFTATPTYLDFPLKLNLKLDIGSIAIFAGGGPTFSLGVFGEYKVEGGDDDSTTDIKWNDSDNFMSLNRTDWGLGFQAGARFSNIQVSAFYEKGMKGIFHNELLSETKNMVIGVSLTYFR